MSEAPTPDAWHLDKRVPLALIGTLLGQTALAVWWAAGLAHQQEDHARRIIALEASSARAAQESQRVSESLARLDERLQGQTAILRRIEEQVAKAAR